MKTRNKSLLTSKDNNKNKTISKIKKSKQVKRKETIKDVSYRDQHNIGRRKSTSSVITYSLDSRLFFDVYAKFNNDNFPKERNIYNGICNNSSPLKTNSDTKCSDSKAKSLSILTSKRHLNSENDSIKDLKDDDSEISSKPKILKVSYEAKPINSDEACIPSPQIPSGSPIRTNNQLNKTYHSTENRIVSTRKSKSTSTVSDKTVKTEIPLKTTTKNETFHKLLENKTIFKKNLAKNLLDKVKSNTQKQKSVLSSSKDTRRLSSRLNKSLNNTDSMRQLNDKKLDSSIKQTNKLKRSDKTPLKSKVDLDLSPPKRGKRIASLNAAAIINCVQNLFNDSPRHSPTRQNRRRTSSKSDIYHETTHKTKENEMRTENLNCNSEEILIKSTTDKEISDKKKISSTINNKKKSISPQKSREKTLKKVTEKQFKKSEENLIINKSQEKSIKKEEKSPSKTDEYSKANLIKTFENDIKKLKKPEEDSKILKKQEYKKSKHFEEDNKKSKKHEANKKSKKHEEDNKKTKNSEENNKKTKNPEEDNKKLKNPEEDNKKTKYPEENNKKSKKPEEDNQKTKNPEENIKTKNPEEDNKISINTEENLLIKINEEHSLESSNEKKSIGKIEQSKKNDNKSDEISNASLPIIDEKSIKKSDDSNKLMEKDKPIKNHIDFAKSNEIDPKIDGKSNSTILLNKNKKKINNNNNNNNNSNNSNISRFFDITKRNNPNKRNESVSIQTNQVKKPKTFTVERIIKRKPKSVDQCFEELSKSTAANKKGKKSIKDEKQIEQNDNDDDDNGESFWEWVGEPYKKTIQLQLGEEICEKTCFNAIRHTRDDIIIRTLDCVMLRSSADQEPFLAKIIVFYLDDETGKKMMTLLWYYRPEHTEQGLLEWHTESDVYASRHLDNNSVDCIEDKAFVLPVEIYSRFMAYQKRQGASTRPGLAARLIPVNNDDALVTEPVENKIDSCTDMFISNWYYTLNFQNSFPPEMTNSNVFVCRGLYDINQHKISRNILQNIQSPKLELIDPCDSVDSAMSISSCESEHKQEDADVVSNNNEIETPLSDIPIPPTKTEKVTNNCLPPISSFQNRLPKLQLDTTVPVAKSCPPPPSSKPIQPPLPNSTNGNVTDCHKQPNGHP